jgi:hypothetical protein
MAKNSRQKTQMLPYVARHKVEIGVHKTDTKSAQNLIKNRIQFCVCVCRPTQNHAEPNSFSVVLTNLLIFAIPREAGGTIVEMY